MESVCIAPIRTELSQTSIVTVVQSLSLFHSLRPHGLQPSRLPCPGILQARVLEWVTISFSRGSSRDWVWFSLPGTWVWSLDHVSACVFLKIKFRLCQKIISLRTDFMCMKKIQDNFHKKTNVASNFQIARGNFSKRCN